MARILTVEDEANIRRLLAVNLEARGHEVLEAGSVEEALPLLEGKPIDVVLLDIRLPGRDGWWLVEQMQHQDQLNQVPVIVVTGETERLYHQSSHRAAPVDDVIAKPISLPSLLQAVQLAVEEPC